MIIDPPSPFASIEDWRAFLADLETVTPQSEGDRAEIRRYIEEAMQAITRAKA